MTDSQTSAVRPQQIAYCSACQEYVQLTREGSCPEGHPRSELRDVRAGTLASAPTVGSAKPRWQAAIDAEPVDEPNVFVAEVLGKSIVLVPVVLVVGFGLVTGYEQFSGMGMSVGLKLGLSAVSLLGTVAVAFIMARRRR